MKIVVAAGHVWHLQDNEAEEYERLKKVHESKLLMMSDLQKETLLHDLVRQACANTIKEYLK